MSQNPFADPYQSPQPFPPGTPVLFPGQKPPVWIWYVCYCLAMALLYLLCAVFGGLILAVADPETPEDYITAVVLLVIGVPLFLLFAAAPILPKTKLAWFYGFATIGIGLTSCCTLPFSIALLIYWLKPDPRSYLNAV